jgi:hypothetical protein
MLDALALSSATFSSLWPDGATDPREALALAGGYR